MTLYVTFKQWELVYEDSELVYGNIREMGLELSFFFWIRTIKKGTTFPVWENEYNYNALSCVMTR